MNEGERVYVYDSETRLPAYDTPRFAPLRALLSKLALNNHPHLWSDRHHVVIPSGGRGKPALKIWVKKNKSESTSDVWMADFRFRFDDSNSSAGFSIEALRAKLGDCTCAEAGLDWLVVSDAQPQTHGMIQGSESHPFIVAVREDELFDTDVWLFVDEMDKTWGRSPHPPVAGEVTEEEDTSEEDEGSDEDHDAGSHPQPPSEHGSKNDDSDDEAEEATADALRLLGSVPLKIVGALYALGSHSFPRGATREELTPMLKRLGITNVGQTLQPARVAPHASWFVHNGERGAKMRLALKPRGVNILEQIYEGYEDRLRRMVAILAGANSKAREPQSTSTTAAELPRPATPPPPPPPPQGSGSGSGSPEAALPVSGFAISSATNEVKRALDDLDAAIANAQGVSKHLRLLLDRVDVD